MEAYGGVDLKIYIFLDSALAGGEWSPSRPGRFACGERASGTHWKGGWVNLRVGRDDVEERKFLTLPGLEFWPLGQFFLIPNRINEFMDLSSLLQTELINHYYVVSSSPASTDCGPWPCPTHD
jgi:hypothetical protein